MVASYQDRHHLICTTAHPLRSLATQKSQTRDQIPGFLCQQNLGGEGKKGHAWKELRYVSEHPAFYERRNCSSTNHYSAVGRWVPLQLLGHGARAEQCSTASSKPSSPCSMRGMAQHLLPVASVGQGIESGVWLRQNCLDENKAPGTQWWKCLELARQLLPACSSGVAISSWQYPLQQCPRDFSLPLCHTPCVSALHRWK